jgi:hypothetical protein
MAHRDGEAIEALISSTAGASLLMAQVNLSGPRIFTQHRIVVDTV